MLDNESPKKYAYIDIARGLAVMGVVGVHTHQLIPGLPQSLVWIFNYGQMGVQLFFVLSALTLCLSASGRHEKSPYSFYIRRYFRIAPLYYSAILFYFTLGILKNYLNHHSFDPQPAYTLTAILSNVLFVHGLYPPGNNSIVPGGWSIGTEMLFYLVFPFIYTLTKEMSSSTCVRLTVKVCVLIFGLEVAIKYFFNSSVDNNAFIYFSILNQLPVFLIGICAFKIQSSKRHQALKMCFAVLLLCLSCLLLNINIAMDYRGFLIPILSAIAFAILVPQLKTIHSQGFIFLLLKNIGRLSYSIYILHFFAEK